MTNQAETSSTLGIEVGAEMPMSVGMPTWPRSLEVHYSNQTADGRPVYVLAVGSEV